MRCGLVGAMGWSDGLATRPLGAGIGSNPGTDTHNSNSNASSKGGWPGGAAGLASILAYMVDQDCRAGVVEVSSEALEARCFEGVEFQAAAGHRRGRPLRPAHRAGAPAPPRQGEAVPPGGARRRGGGQRR